MRTVRLGDELDGMLDATANRMGKSASEVIRVAVRRYCEEVGGATLYDRLSDIIGSVSSKGGNSRKTGRDFKKILRAKYKGKVRT